MPTPQPLPDIFISNEIANSRVSNYLLDKHPLLLDAQKEKGEERNETTSIWYSKEHIETWLSEINLMNADGMRIYFGAYNEDEDLVPGQLCLVMRLTRETENGHVDIIYENEPDFEDRQNAEARSRTITDVNVEDSELPKQFNYGAPCPPIC